MKAVTKTPTASNWNGSMRAHDRLQFDLTCLQYRIFLVTRLFHICLLLAALGGLIGQSTAMAMVPAPIGTGSLQASMAGMDCMDMANSPASGKMPCNKMTQQCMAAMGCAPAVLVQPDAMNMSSPSVDRAKSAMPLAARLWGRSYGPEPDPPSFLI